MFYTGDRRPEDTTISLSTISKSLLSLALAVYVPCMFISAGHPIGAFSQLLEPIFKRTLGYLGLNNPYRFFAPDPLTDNLLLDATLRYADGTNANWVCPHFINGQTSDLDHQRNMVHYYWQYRMVIEPQNSIFWPDACKYIFRSQKHKQSALVTLYKNAQPISVPYSGGQQVEQQAATQSLLQYEVNSAGDSK